MIRNFLRPALAVIACILGLTVSAQAASLVLTSPKIYRLQNGLTVLVREDNRFPLASVRLYVKAGSAWERPDEAGISHLLEHMVFKGSKTREEGVDKMVESAGGYLNASTSFDTTIYLTDLPSDKWKTAMEAVRDLAFDPLLLQTDLEAELEVVLAEMKQRGDSPFTKLYHALFATALRGTPYASPVIGTEETLREVTPESMRAYIQRRYDPRDMLLVVAGKVEAVEVLDKARELFGRYPNLNDVELSEHFLPENLAHGMRMDVQEGPWNKAYIAMAFPLPGAGAARLPAADILAQVLGGDDTALLPRLLRIDNDTVDVVSVSAMWFERVGLFMIMAQLDASKQETFLREVSGVLTNLQATDFTDEELERAKLNLTDSFMRSQETIANIADFTGDMYFYSPADPTGAHYLDTITDVSREQMQAVVSDWLRPEAMTVVSLTPRPAKGEPAVSGRSLAAAIGSAWPEAAAQWAAQEKGEFKPEVMRATPATLQEPETVDLGPGRTLVMQEDKSLPYVSATLMFAGGEILNSMDTEGLPSVTADVLVSGTQQKNYGAMNAFLSNRASILGATSTTLSFSINLDAPSRFSKDVFDLLREVLTGPAFREEDLARVRREHVAGIASMEESVMGMVKRHLSAFLFPGNPYGHRNGGTRESLEALTLDDVRKFWSKQSAQPWVLAVVGDFEREEILEFARGLPEPAAEKATVSPPEWSKTMELRITLPERQQAAYLMLFPTVPFEHEDSIALQLLSASIDGFGGMLFQELREKESLGYSVTPINWTTQDAGFLAFSIIAAPENLPRAQQGFARIARSLQAVPLPPVAVERGKARLEADYFKGLQRRSVRAETAARLTMHGKPLDVIKRRMEAMMKLTPHDLREAARKYMDPDRAYSLTVSP